jgi:hypothetical protein
VYDATQSSQLSYSGCTGGLGLCQTIMLPASTSVSGLQGSVTFVLAYTIGCSGGSPLCNTTPYNVKFEPNTSGTSIPINGLSGNTITFSNANSPSATSPLIVTFTYDATNTASAAGAWIANVVPYTGNFVQNNGLTQHQVVVGSGTGGTVVASISSVGTAGEPLVSEAGSADPIFTNQETLGTTGLSTQSWLTCYGSTGSSNKAPCYHEFLDESGTILSYLYGSTTFAGALGISSTTPTTDVAAGSVLYSGGGVNVVDTTGSSSTTGLLQCLSGTNTVTDCSSNATNFVGVSEGTGNSLTRQRSFGVVTVNIPSSTTTAGDFICSGTLSAATYNALDNGSTACPGGQQVGFATATNSSAVTSVRVQLTSANGISFSGFSGLTNHAPIVATSTTSVGSTAAMTNGQLLIGSTGNAPVPATLTQGTGISITDSAGAITISATGGGSGPCQNHQYAIPGSSDSITSPTTFATTISLATTCVGVGSFIDIRAHGTYTTGSTASPLIAFQVNAGNTSGICPATAHSTSPAINQTASIWDLECKIQINTIGAPGTAVAWGNVEWTNSTATSGAQILLSFNNNSTGTVNFTTTGAETVSIQETATPVSGQIYNLTALDIQVTQ